MKKSKIILGTSAFLLAIAGAYATKASKVLHQVNGWTAGVQGSSSCKAVSKLFTATALGNSRTLKTGPGVTPSITVFTSDDCVNVLHTINNSH